MTKCCDSKWKNNNFIPIDPVHEHDGDALAAAEAHPRAGRLQSPLRGSARQNHSGKERLLWLLYCGSRVHGQKVMGLNLANYESRKNKFYASQNG